MAQLLSCYAISLLAARPVLPVGRVTIEPSYVNPYFDWLCLGRRDALLRRDHSGFPLSVGRPTRVSSRARNVGWSLTLVHMARSRRRWRRSG